MACQRESCTQKMTFGQSEKRLGGPVALPGLAVVLLGLLCLAAAMAAATAAATTTATATATKVAALVFALPVLPRLATAFPGLATALPRLAAGLLALAALLVLHAV